jgi:hypothetical protein
MTVGILKFEETFLTEMEYIIFLITAFPTDDCFPDKNMLIWTMNEVKPISYN